MIKRFILGAALGAFGKKLYDEGRLDPYIARAKEKFSGLAADEAGTVPRRSSAKPAATDKG